MADTVRGEWAHRRGGEGDWEKGRMNEDTGMGGRGAWARERLGAWTLESVVIANCLACDLSAEALAKAEAIS